MLFFILTTCLYARMTTQELEELLQVATESPNLEFKGACIWSDNTFVKDILAMSNIRDGGYIVVGVEDGSFVRQGVTTEQIETYKIDTMKDGIRWSADPYVDLRVDVPKGFCR